MNDKSKRFPESDIKTKLKGLSYNLIEYVENIFLYLYNFAFRLSILVIKIESRIRSEYENRLDVSFLEKKNAISNISLKKS